MNFLKPVSSGGFGGLVYAGKIDEFPVGTVSHILSGRFYISSTENGLIAMWQRCTHLGCAIPWVEGEKQFHCPCHGSLFDPTGVVTGGPAPRPMDTFPIVIKGDEVWVDTGKPTQRSNFDPSQLTQV
jgi:cytochrome b6-f complex iron-sulfur subunit